MRCLPAGQVLQRGRHRILFCVYGAARAAAAAGRATRHLAHPRCRQRCKHKKWIGKRNYVIGTRSSIARSLAARNAPAAFGPMTIVYLSPRRARQLAVAGRANLPKTPPRVLRDEALRV